MRKWRRVSQEETETVIRLREEGLDRAAIAERLFLSKDRVCYVLRKAGHRCFSRRAIPAAEIEECVRLREDGLNNTQIARRMGTNRDRVAGILKGRGIASPWTVSEEERRRYLEMWNSGVGYSEIARRCGVGRNRVRNAVWRHPDAIPHAEIVRRKYERIAETAVREHLSIAEVRRRFGGYGKKVAAAVKARPDWKPEWTQSRPVHSQETFDRVGEMAASGIKMHEIAKTLGIDYQAAYGLWKRHPKFEIRVPKTGDAARRRREKANES